MTHKQITATFAGRLGQEPKQQTSASGITWTRLRCAVASGNAIEWVQVCVSDSAAQRACAALQKGDEILVTGRLWLSRWVGLDGQERCGLSCAAGAVERLGDVDQRIEPEKTEEAPAEAQADAPRRRRRHARRHWQAPLSYDERDDRCGDDVREHVERLRA